MRPLEGVVIETGVVLVIRLKSRALVRVPEQKDLKLGDTCYILFDYTRLEVHMIWTEAEYDAEDNSSGEEFEYLLPPDWEEPHKWLHEA